MRGRRGAHIAEELVDLIVDEVRAARPPRDLRALGGGGGRGGARAAAAARAAASSFAVLSSALSRAISASSAAAAAVSSAAPGSAALGGDFAFFFCFAFGLPPPQLDAIVFDSKVRVLPPRVASRPGPSFR